MAGRAPGASGDDRQPGPPPGKEAGGGGEGGGEAPPPRKGPFRGSSRWLAAVWLVMLGVFAWLIVSPPSSEPSAQNLTFTQVLHKVQDKQVGDVSVDSNGSLTGHLKSGAAFKSQVPTAFGSSDLYKVFDAGGVNVTATGPSSSWGGTMAITLLPILLLIGFFVWMGRRAGGAMGAVGNIGRSRVKVVDTERPTVSFADVAGYEGVKREVGEIIDFLREPDRYRLAGAVGPRGVLMVGPPGTGKTLLARAIAGEASVPFLSVTGSGFVEMFVGVGAARVRDLFDQARKLAPAIIFIDEIDAIGQRRGGAIISNDEREQTLNQLLAEMDGFSPAEGVVVLAATNRPDVLDPALLRPGRFDRQVVVPLPNQIERRAILEVHCRTKQLAPDVDLEAVARGTPGFSGADLANLTNEAAIHAVRAGRVALSRSDFSEARDRILLGLREGSNVLLPEEKRAVATHEAGHALVAALSESADPVEKITILPAGVALGVTEQLPLAERHLLSETYMRSALAIRLAGRAAELVRYGEGSTGAANDLAQATDLATRMVREFGLSDQLGPVGYSPGGPMYLGHDQVTSRQYSEETQHLIDTEVRRLVRDAERAALELITEHRTELDQLADLLLTHETVDGAEVYRLVGRPAPQRHFENGNGKHHDDKGSGRSRKTSGSGSGNGNGGKGSGQTAGTEAAPETVGEVITLPVRHRRPRRTSVPSTRSEASPE